MEGWNNGRAAALRTCRGCARHSIKLLHVQPKASPGCKAGLSRLINQGPSQGHGQDDDRVRVVYDSYPFATYHSSYPASHDESKQTSSDQLTYHAAVYVYAVHSHASTIIIHTRQPTTKPTPPIPKEIYSFGEGENSASRFRSVSSASLSILEMSSLQVGMSWIRPMTWPAVQTPCSGSPLMKTSRPRLPLT